MQKDMQLAVHTRFIDSSTSVREAAIELVGKFILIRPELTAQYYDMLSERILVRSTFVFSLSAKTGFRDDGARDLRLKIATIDVPYCDRSGHGHQREEEGHKNIQRHLLGTAELSQGARDVRENGQEGQRRRGHQGGSTYLPPDWVVLHQSMKEHILYCLH